MLHKLGYIRNWNSSVIFIATFDCSNGQQWVSVIKRKLRFNRASEKD
jgi:hypothetical protein